MKPIITSFFSALVGGLMAIVLAGKSEKVKSDYLLSKFDTLETSVSQNMLDIHELYRWQTDHEDFCFILFDSDSIQIDR